MRTTLVEVPLPAQLGRFWLPIGNEFAAGWRERRTKIAARALLDDCGERIALLPQLLRDRAFEHELSLEVVTAVWRDIIMPGCFAIGGGAYGGKLGISTSFIQTTSTWTRPAGSRWHDVWAFGSAGGGGSGRRGLTSTARGGGGGGGSGGICYSGYPGTMLGSTESVTVPAGGPGGPAITVDSTNGTAGTTPSAFTTFSSVAGYQMTAGPGGGGGGGTTTGGTAGAGGGNNGGSVYPQQDGTNGLAGGLGGIGAGAGTGVGETSVPGNVVRLSRPGGGGGGGGISAANATEAGASGGQGGFANGAVCAGGTGAANAAGNPGTASGAQDAVGGGGGAGGSSGTTKTGGAGGFAAGGGGAGAALNGTNSGLGGTGGTGGVISISMLR
jgi:hypothetical protein